MDKKVIVIPSEQVLKHSGNAPSVLRVAAYCRVSTDEERQLGSFDNQIEYFARLITGNNRYELVKIYSDEGISGTSIRSRKGFCEMIQDCEAGKIDLIITKSISRFARNTQDSLNYTRLLKGMGIGVLFEKEGINTLESSGELLLTLFSCFAQEESRSISENTAWGIRSKFQQGIPHINAQVLLGYDKDADGNLVINEVQAEVVRRIYRCYLEGYSLGSIARTLNEDGIPGVRGKPKWCGNTISRVLANEKYRGSLLMQKTFTASFLTKQHIPNTGQLAQYYIEDDHPAIIPPDIWEAAQEETARRRAFRAEHGLRGLSGAGGSPFYSRIFCRQCGQRLQRIYHHGVSHPYWQCPSCSSSKHPVRLSESLLRSCFCDAFNHVVKHRDDYMSQWQTMITTGTPLQRLRAQQMIDITAGGTIPFEIPELTQAVLREVWFEKDGFLNICFHTCTVRTKVDMVDIVR